MEFIETHSHLTDAAFDNDRKEVIQKIFAAGVKKIVDIECSRDSWEKGLALSSEYAGSVYFACGLHPEYTDAADSDFLPELKKYLALPSALALGEVGLDYWWRSDDRKKQIELLEKQLPLSSQTGKPAVFHARSSRDGSLRAYTELLDILEKHWDYSTSLRRGILHCFSGNWEEAKRGLDMGLLLGINGSFTYKGNGVLREVIKKAGVENIVLETDCPYLPPVGRRGRRNDSSYIPEIADFAASEFDLPDRVFCNMVYENAGKIFPVLSRKKTASFQ